MPTQGQQVPASWAGHAENRNAPNQRTSSDTRFSVQFDEESQQHHAPTSSAFLRPEDGQEETAQQHLRRRRSSIADRVNALRSAGGLNSFDNFARSWQRAAGFFEVMPVRQSFRYTDGEHSEEGEPEYQREEIIPSPMAQRSLLREQLASEERPELRNVFEEEEAPEQAGQDEITPLPQIRSDSQDHGANERTRLLRKRSSRSHDDNIFSIEPQLASPFGGSYGTTWGSLS